MHFLLSILIYLYAALPIFKLIQVKEYFFPSIWAHFDYPSTWRDFFSKREILLFLVYFVLLALSIFKINFNIPENNLVYFSALLIVFFLLLKRFYFLKTINWTPKFIFINALFLLIVLRILQITNLSVLIFVFLLTKLGTLPLALFSTFLGNVITNIYATFLYKRANEKIIQWKKVKGHIVIGITGSYGKSSTKEIISQLLNVRYKTLSSPKRLNAEIGLSQFILKKNLNEFELIVLEMGARKIGEIDTMVKIFKPDIVYITGIAPQHVATFGSLKNIIKGKLEIIKAVIPNGIALFNGNDEFLSKIYDEINIPRKYIYSTSNASKIKSHFYSKYEECSLDGSIFTFVYPDGEIRLKTNLIATHQLENLVGALAGCYLLGIKPNELSNKIMNLELLPHSFEVISKKGGPIIIDDSYNANLIGVEKGSEYFLSLPFKEKVIIFAGILELGVETPDFYKRLLETFKKANKLFLTFTDFAEIFLENLNNAKIISKEEFKKFYEEFPEDGGILILGRVPSWVFEIIKK